MLVFTFSLGRIVECPVFDISLSALHHGTANPAPALPEGSSIGFRKVQVFFGYPQLRTNAVEAQFPVGSLERKGMIRRNFPPPYYPFVHAPKVGRVQRQVQRID